MKKKKKITSIYQRHQYKISGLSKFDDMHSKQK